VEESSLKWTYSKAGVNLKKIKNIHAFLQDYLNFPKRKEVLLGLGHYSSLIELQEKVLALHVDGVGTKILVALKANKLDTIGIDCVAMNVNDILCVGAEPLAFLDYLALAKADEEMVKEVMKGLAKGAEEANVSIVGGETAIVPDLIKAPLDLIGMAIGICDKNKLILGDKIEEGDVVIGLESSGLHSNGYTLVRKVLLSKYNLEDRLEGLDRSLKEELLEPTRIYVRPILNLLKENLEVKGLAHITGGAFTKLNRLIKGKNLSFKLNLPKPKPIFDIIKKEGNMEDLEMYRTFNMGIGFCVITSKKDFNRVKDSLEKYVKAYKIGYVDKGEGIYIGNRRIDL